MAAADQPQHSEPTGDNSSPAGDCAQARLDSLPEIQSELKSFAKERDWEQYHTPRNLVLALVGEVGELSEIFQWKGEVLPGLPGFTGAERKHLGEELSDCLLYLVRLADVCGVDLGAAVAAKLQANARKYPVDKCKGRSTKYTELQQQQHGS